MKKLITLTLTLILVSVLATAQRGGKQTVEQFYNKYCNLPGYSSLAVTDDMFKMIGEMEEGDAEMIKFLSKLKYVRYLEYNPKKVSNISSGTGISSKSGYGNTFVDGVKVNSSAKNTRSKKRNKTIASTGTSNPNSQGTAFNTFTKQASSSMVHDRALAEINFIQYKTLMKSNQEGEKLTFLGFQYSSSPNEWQFVLLSGNTLIQIRGDVKIKHLYELEEILKAVGEILPNES